MCAAACAPLRGPSPCPADGHAAIDVDELARQETALVACEEESHLCDLFRLPDALDGVDLGDVRDCLQGRAWLPAASSEASGAPVLLAPAAHCVTQRWASARAQSGRGGHRHAATPPRRHASISLSLRGSRPGPTRHTRTHAHTHAHTHTHTPRARALSLSPSFNGCAGVTAAALTAPASSTLLTSSGVMIAPGLMVLTVMPFPLYSQAIERVMAMRAPFEAEYATTPSWDWWPWTDPMWMMLPLPCARNEGRQCFENRNAAVRLTSMSRCLAP